MVLQNSARLLRGPRGERKYTNTTEAKRRTSRIIIVESRWEAGGRLSKLFSNLGLVRFLTRTISFDLCKLSTGDVTEKHCQFC